jgi:hypothetical protein
MAPALLVGLVCAAYFAAYLRATSGGWPLSPDVEHYGDVARNLLRGEGFTVDIIEYHLGLRDAVRHVPEQHGMLRPLELLPLFAVFGFESALFRVPALAYQVLTAAVAFFLARRLFGVAAGVVAGVLILGDPLLTWCARSGSDDIGFAFYCLCTLAALELAFARGRDAWFGRGYQASAEKQAGCCVAGAALAWLAATGTRARSRRDAWSFRLCFAFTDPQRFPPTAFRLCPLCDWNAAGYQGITACIRRRSIGETLTRPAGAVARTSRTVAVFAREVVGLPLPAAGDRWRAELSWPGRRAGAARPHGPCTDLVAPAARWLFCGLWHAGRCASRRCWFAYALTRGAIRTAGGGGAGGRP